MKKPFAIRDAASFYAAIKNNPFYEQFDDRELVEILEEEFKFRKEAAEHRRFRDNKRDEFMFWQGAQLGCILMRKIFLHNLAAQASDQGVQLADQTRH